MTAHVLYKDMGAPNVQPFTIEKKDGETWDPESVVSADIRVQKPDETTAETWTATIESQDANGITVVHALDDSDLDVVGMWRAYVRLYDAGGGIVRTYTATFIVKAEFGL